MTIRITKGKHRSVSAMREIRTTKEPRIIMSDKPNNHTIKEVIQFI